MAALALAFDVLARDKASATLNKVGNEAQKTGGHISRMGVAAAAGFAAVAAGATVFAKKSVSAFKNAASNANGLRRVMGGTIEDASRLGFAAQQTGVGTDQLAGALRTLSVHLTAGSKATKATIVGYKYVIEQVPHLVKGHIAYHDALKKVAITAPGVAKDAVALGFAYKDAHGRVLPMAQLLPKIAEKFKDLPDGAEKTALAVKLFGRSGTALLPFLNKGAAGIAELSKQSDKLGLTLTGRDLNAIKQNAQAHKDFSAAVQGLEISVGRLLLPVLARLATIAASTLVPAIAKVTTFLNAQLRPVVADVTDDLDSFLAGLQGRGAADGFAKLGESARVVLARIKTGLQEAKDVLGDFVQGFTGAAEQRVSTGPQGTIDPTRGSTTAAQDFGKRARQAFDDVYASVHDKLIPALQILGKHAIELGRTLSTALLPIVGRLTSLVLDMSGALVPMAAAFLAVNAAINVGQGIVETARDAYGVYKDTIAALIKVKAFFIATTDTETGAVTLSGVAQLRATIATKAATVATGVATIATGLQTAAVLALDAALGILLSPVALVVVAIAALAGALVLAYKKSETFRDVVQGVFKVVGGAVLTLVDLWLGAWQAFARGMSHVPFIGDKFKGVAEGIGMVRDKIGDMKSDLADLGNKTNVIPVLLKVAVDAANAGIRSGALSGSEAAASATTRSHRAMGGPVGAGRSYLVGEHEPEWFVPDVSGRIVNQRQAAEAVGGRGLNHYGDIIIQKADAETDPQAVSRAMTNRAFLMGFA